MRNSIRTRLAITFIALAASLLVLVGVVLAWQSYVTEQARAITLQSEQAQRISIQVRSYIQTQENALTELMAVRGLQGLDQSQQTQLLSELVSYSKAFNTLSLVGSNGYEKIVVSSTQVVAQLRNLSTADEFTGPISNNQIYYGPVQFSENTGEPFMIIAAPMMEVRSGKVTDVLVAEVRLKPVWDLFASITRGQGSSTYIVDSQNRVVAHNNPSVVLRNTLFTVPAQDGVNTGVNGTNVVLAANKIKLGRQEFAIVTETPTSEAFSTVVKTELTIAILLLVAIIIAGVLGWLAARQIVRPIQTLVNTVQAISIGDLSKQVEVTSQDEIGNLGKAFNSMTARLRETLTGLEQRVADRTKALATSTEISRRLSTILDQKQLVSEVVNQVKDAFGYYQAQIYLYDPAQENLVMAGGTGEAGEKMLAQFHKVAKGRGLVGRAAESNRPVLVSDTSKNSAWLPNQLLPETESEVAIPISVGDQVLGVLDVQHSVVDGLQQEDADLLQSIANQVAIALQNIQSTEIVAKRAAELQTVSTIGISAATISDVQKMLETVVHLTQRGFGLYHAHVFLYDKDTTELVITACGYKEGDEHEGTHGTTAIPIAQEQSLVARAGRTRQPVIVNDVRNEPGWLPNPLLPDTASELAVPLIVGDELLGVLDVQSERLNAFTSEDASIQTTLASQIAVALQNARNLSQSQQQAEQEATLNRIAQKIQGTATMDEALKIAARELGHALGQLPTLVELEPSLLNLERKSADYE